MLRNMGVKAAALIWLYFVNISSVPRSHVEKNAYFNQFLYNFVCKVRTEMSDLSVICVILPKHLYKYSLYLKLKSETSHVL